MSENESKSIKRVQKGIKPAGEMELEIGAYYFDNSSSDQRLYRVDKIEEKPRKDKSGKSPIITWVYYTEIDMSGLYSKRTDKEELPEFVKGYYRNDQKRMVPRHLWRPKMRETLAALRAEALAALQNLDEYFADNQTSNATAIVPTTGTAQNARQAMDMIAALQDRAILLRQQAEAMAAIVEVQVKLYQTRLSYLQDVLGLLEIYLGMDKEFVLVKDGTPAAATTPITIRQLILCADEEVGDLTRYEATTIFNKKIFWRGLGAEDMDKFDAWMLENDNYKNIVPEERCVVGVRPRYHSEREYEKDYQLHLIVRNGEQIHRVTIDDFLIGSMLFPSAKEWDELLVKIAELEEDKENREQSLLKEKSRQIAFMEPIAFLQGLINQGEVLLPLPHAINLFDPLSYGDTVQVIRDAEGEGMLATGLPSFDVWKKKLNSTLKLGDFVIIADSVDEQIGRKEEARARRFDDRFQHSAPPNPKPGRYVIEKAAEKKFWYSSKPHTEFQILFLPDTEEYLSTGEGWYDHEYRRRKKRVAFRIYADDDFVFAYDNVKLSDVEYYLGNRLERRQYAKMLPVLNQIVTELRAERDAEKDFVALVASELQVAESKVWSAVQWWKRKVKINRSIASDDAKAWRMIRQRISKTAA